MASDLADARSCSVTSALWPFLLAMMRAGMPTAVAPAGTGLMTTALLPILAPSPTSKPPSTLAPALTTTDRKSTRLNSSHLVISYAVFCLKKKTQHHPRPQSPLTPLQLNNTDAH